MKKTTPKKKPSSECAAYMKDLGIGDVRFTIEVRDKDHSLVGIGLVGVDGNNNVFLGDYTAISQMAKAMDDLARKRAFNSLMDYKEIIDLEKRTDRTLRRRRSE